MKKSPGHPGAAKRAAAEVPAGEPAANRPAPAAAGRHPVRSPDAEPERTMTRDPLVLRSPARPGRPMRCACSRCWPGTRCRSGSSCPPMGGGCCRRNAGSATRPASAPRPADWGSVTLFTDNDRGALPASGSRRTSGMVICPCSMGTVSAVAHGIQPVAGGAGGGCHPEGAAQAGPGAAGDAALPGASPQPHRRHRGGRRRSSRRARFLSPPAEAVANWWTSSCSGSSTRSGWISRSRSDGRDNCA